MRAYTLVTLLVLSSFSRASLADGLSAPSPDLTQRHLDAVRFEKRQKRLTIAGALLITIGVPLQLVSAGILGTAVGCGLGEHYNCPGTNDSAFFPTTAALIGVGSLMFIAGTILLGAAHGDRKRARSLRALPGVSVSSTGASLSWGLKF